MYLRSRIVLLGWMSWTAGCVVPTEDPCAEDPRPLEFCADIHALEQPDVRAWVCLDKSCDIAEGLLDGCLQSEAAIEAGIEAEDACVRGWGPASEPGQ